MYKGRAFETIKADSVNNTEIDVYNIWKTPTFTAQIFEIPGSSSPSYKAHFNNAASTKRLSVIGWISGKSAVCVRFLRRN